MANKLRITKADGTVHFVPIKSLRNQHRLNAHLPASMKMRFEEVNEKDEVVRVLAEGSRGKVLSAEIENAKLRAKIAELEQEKARTSPPSPKPDVKNIIEKINAATNQQELDEITEGDNRAQVMKAAIAKAKTFSEE